MRKLLLCVMLLALPSCCAKPSVVNPRPCVVPVSPELPSVQIAVCGDQVCLSKDDTVKLARYLDELQMVDQAIAACNLAVRQ